MTSSNVNTSSLNDSVFLILGATGCVGSVVAQNLAAAGARVVVAGRNPHDGDHLSACEFIPVEANDLTSIDNAVSQTVERFGRIDGAANCIGSVLLKPAHLTSDAEWHETIALNLTSSFALLRAAARPMRKTGGSIVFVSSAAAGIGLPNHEAIAAAKAGVNGLMLSAAASYASRNIRVNTVAPGLVKSKMTRSLWENPQSAATSESMHALGRLGDPQDVASAICWLLNPANSWVTGQVIGVDGGLGSLLPRTRA